MKKRLKGFISLAACVAVMLSFVLTGCGLSGGGKEEGPPDIGGLTYEGTMETRYAEGFDVYFYSGGYAVIDVHQNQRYLVVPEGGEIPEDLPQDMTILQKPVDNIYLAASSVMALFDSLGAMDSIRYTATKEGDWYVENAARAMKEGRIAFAGKYSQPDYEALVEGGCSLAVESTMILHSPEVKEKLEELGIPVFIDYSSYESHPLGRSEWIKVYGVMTDKEAEADEFFAGQTRIIDELEGFDNTEKTVAYFFINSSGSVVVRKSDDYIPMMIELAGGRYAFDDLENTESNASSVNISMEQFYNEAADADYLIYNATIENPLKSIAELTDKSRLFEDFKAVKEGNVWTTDKYMYQATDITGEFINDIHKMLTDGNPEDMTFLTKVE